MQPPTELIIDARYNGPCGLGNGGYIAGALAAFVSGDSEVRIMKGFPLDTSLAVVRDPDGGVRCLLEDQVLGTARPIAFDLAVPVPPPPDAARRAGGRFRFLHDSDPRGCYVCSPKRSPGDGLRLFCGPLLPGESASAAVAGVWRPDAELADGEGWIPSRLVWAALDCPGAYAIAALAPDAGRQLLGTCGASLKGPLYAGESYILSSWQLAPPEGRKRFMGVAIHDVAGELLAWARQIWIDAGPRPAAD